MTASDFDRLIKGTRGALEARQESPEKLEGMLQERLAGNFCTFDGTVFEVVYAWRNYESMTVGRCEEGSFPRTLQLIDSLLQQAEHQPMLHAALAEIKGDILHNLGNLQGAAAAFADTVDDLHALHLDVDSKRINAMLRLGQILLAQGKKRDAEKLFLDILSYPWWLVMEVEPQTLLCNDYIRAGLGLIECRRGDLAALQEIFFVPATQAELMPLLGKAIAEAQATAANFPT